MTHKIAMQELNSYAAGLCRLDAYTCPSTILQEAPQSPFAEEVQQMLMHGKEIVALVSTTSHPLTMRQMEDTCGSLHVLSRKIDERMRMLNFAISRAPEMEKNCVILSKPDVDRAKNPKGWIEQVLERSLPRLSCIGFFGQSIGKLNLSDAVAIMREELTQIDLARCKQIAAEYAHSSKEILGLATNLSQAIVEANTSLYGRRG